jgi:hypothetical protein
MRTIKIFVTLFVTLSVFSCATKDSIKSNLENLNFKDQKYVLGSTDIPLFDGLTLMDEDSTSFDTMSGDIVISKYVGDFKLKLVKNFYLTTLPQLGWRLVDKKSDKISFKREKDKLEIKFDYASNGLYVRFFISSVLQ